LRAVRDGEDIALQTMMRFFTLRGEGRPRRASEPRRVRFSCTGEGPSAHIISLHGAFPACCVIGDGGGLVVVRASGDL